MTAAKILLPLVFTLMAGCSFPPSPHDQRLAEPQHGRAATYKLTVNSNTSFGVLYSPDTLYDIDYLKRYNDHAKHSVEGRLLVSEIRQGYIDSSAPLEGVGRIRQILSLHLPNVTFYENEAALSKAKPDFIVVVTTRHVLLTPRASDIEARFRADFFDRDLVYVGSAGGKQVAHMPALWTHAQRTPEIVAQLVNQHAVQTRALHDFDSSLVNLVSKQTGAVTSNTP